MEMASRVEELADGHLVTGEKREVWDRIQQRERSPFSAAPAAGLEDQPALSSLIGADLGQFRPASERVVHVAAEPHHEEGVIDESPAHVLHEKRLAADRVNVELLAEATEEEATEDETSPDEEPQDAGRWARPRQ
jgi:hypothetical protein